MNWHYVEQGQQAGPVTGEQLAALFQDGKITDETPVWREGLPDWQPFREVRAEILQADSPGAENSPAIPEAVCAECGKIFPAAETIRHGNVHVCAACKPVFLQKLSEGAPINTGGLNYAGIGPRFAAVFLDGLLLGVINVGINFVMTMTVMRGAETNSSAAVTIQIVLFVINTSIGVTYETFFIGKYGATLGKMACKIKVVTADGGRVTYARAFGRYFAKMLSAFTCLIGYIIALFDNPQKRALHDHICNTRVVLK